MDKFFLLTYTSIGADGYRHVRHAWFETEEAMKEFVTDASSEEIEVDLAIEILSHRIIEME